MLDTLTRNAVNHTLHCLLGCSIGEILGMAISTALGWSNLANIILAIALAFFFGYLLTIRSLYKKNVKGKKALNTAIATDTSSITSMEFFDNGFILLVPGAVNAQLDNSLFWISLAVSLVVAFVFTVPINRWFLSISDSHHRHH